MLGQDADLKNAKKHFDRGSAAIESAESLEDFNVAINEFEKAKTYAPEWADVYYNLGIVYDRVEKYNEALNNLRNYLSLEPNAEDTGEVETMINKIEYKMEKAFDKQKMYEKLIGTWDRYDSETGEKYESFIFFYDGNNLMVRVGGEYSTTTAPVNFDGKKLEFNHLHVMTVYDSDVYYEYTLTGDGIMKGFIQVNVINVKSNDRIFKVGKKPRMPMEMRKR